MHHFFVKPEAIADGMVALTGDNYRHAKQVLRVKVGEKLLVSDGSGTDYMCEVTGLRTEEESEQGEAAVLLRIDFQEAPHELPAQVYLFQGLPKSDKLELIIQKAVELGAYQIVPVKTKNAVVKLDAKKEASKTARWQAIAEAAAKQSKRSIVPLVHTPLDFHEALALCEAFELKLIPYENAQDIGKTMRMLAELKSGARVAIFIGPEGGFAPEEIAAAEAAGVVPITLGKRILRTETASICAMSAVMLSLEQSAEL